MTPEVKDRIEQIRHGNVPDGFVKDRDGIHPVDWTAQKMGQWLKLTERPVVLEDDETYQLVTVRRGYGGVDSRGYFLGKNVLVKNYFSVNTGDFIISKRQIAHGACGVVPEELNGAAVSNEYNVFIPQEGTNIHMFNLMMQLPHYKRLFYLMSDGVHIEKLLFKTQDWMRRVLAMPPFEEQEKITQILTTQDKVIELQEKRLAEKRRQKKYLMQQLLTGKKRLPGFVEDWKIAPIDNFLESRNTKQIPCEEAPLMAFIAGEGVASKGERYDRSHLVKDDTKKYKRTELNDFIYSSNNLDVGSIGLNKYGTAVISVVYEIFRAKENVVPAVISEIIQMPRNLHHILSYRQGAFYGQYRIFAEDFLSVPIKAPCYEEQLEIGALLDTADNEIDLLRQELEQEKQKKKALMQLLLTGIVRVNV